MNTHNHICEEVIISAMDRITQNKYCKNNSFFLIQKNKQCNCDDNDYYNSNGFIVDEHLAYITPTDVWDELVNNDW
jgi:hypothetical protein